MTINEYLEKHKRIKNVKGYDYRDLTPRVEMTDGFSMSVQVSKFAYCTPRVNDAHFYYTVEVGFPSEPEELLMPYVEDEENPTETVYGYVPVEVVNTIIEKHGGIKHTQEEQLSDKKDHDVRIIPDKIKGS